MLVFFIWILFIDYFTVEKEQQSMFLFLYFFYNKASCSNYAGATCLFWSRKLEFIQPDANIWVRCNWERHFKEQIFRNSNLCWWPLWASVSTLHVSWSLKVEEENGGSVVSHVKTTVRMWARNLEGISQAQKKEKWYLQRWWGRGDSKLKCRLNLYWMPNLGVGSMRVGIGLIYVIYLP